MRLRDRLWGLVPTFLIARRNITRARTRSALAVASIVIGVVAIGAIGAGGVAFKEAQMGTLGTIGSDLQVYPGPDTDAETLTQADVDTLDRVTGTAGIVPVKSDGAHLFERGEAVADVTAYGVDRPGRLYTVAEGNVPDNWRNGALVGRTLADDHGLEPGDKLTLDRTVVRDGEVSSVRESYRVAAVLEDEGRAQVARPNSAVVVPPERFETDGYAQAVVRTDDAREANDTAGAIRETFNGREEVVTVFERAQAADRIDRAFAQVNLFLVGIGAISLLVAGVSIANVMLMSAIERREEIGVLRAVGYEKSDILRVLLAEATLLGVVGSVLGAPLAIGITAVINDALLDDPLAFTTAALSYVAAGVAFGVVASMVGGLYPAWTAARERPVEALRG